MKLPNSTAGLCLGLIAALCVAAGCEHDPKPKERPANVPATAQWVAGQDQGAYYDCSTGGPVNECTVWNDTDGSVRVNGRFLLNDLNRAATYSELRYASADSSHIFLDHGLTLNRANK